MQEDDIIAKVLEFIPDEAQEQAQLASTLSWRAAGAWAKPKTFA
ncbi:hypothetical protein GGI1_14943 [Acidithiobacillus sp. GGI-221]|nr:hypothetical protein GGI1_14943 [Acidithiobacillus sp. GGI-221]